MRVTRGLSLVRKLLLPRRSNKIVSVYVADLGASYYSITLLATIRTGTPIRGGRAHSSVYVYGLGSPPPGRVVPVERMRSEAHGDYLIILEYKGI